MPISLNRIVQTGCGFPLRAHAANVAELLRGVIDRVLSLLKDFERELHALFRCTTAGRSHVVGFQPHVSNRARRRQAEIWQVPALRRVDCGLIAARGAGLEVECPAPVEIGLACE